MVTAKSTISLKEKFKMKKIGISCRGIVKDMGIGRGFEFIKKCGFDTVDFGLEGYKVGDKIYGGSLDQFETHFTEIKETAKHFELEISQTHGRCATYWPEDDEHNAMVDEVCKYDLHATGVLGAPACVIHFPNNTRWGKCTPSLMHEKAAELYDKCLPHAEKNKVAIAMETFGAARVNGARIADFFAFPNEFLHQFNRLDTKYKTICVDTGHTHEAESFWVPSPEEMIKILGKDVTILHLHDNTGHWDDHLLPGLGNINWPAIFDSLDEIGYTGTYNFELRIPFKGTMMQDFVAYAGKYLREFVDRRGDLK